MNYSVFEVFRIGIGPSSSHTVGPMIAVNRFIQELASRKLLPQQVQVHLYGSLALTGIGHATDKAVLAGLVGWLPDSIDPLEIEPLVQSITQTGRLMLMGKHDIAFDVSQHLSFIATKLCQNTPTACCWRLFRKTVTLCIATPISLLVAERC